MLFQERVVSGEIQALSTDLSVEWVTVKQVQYSIWAVLYYILKNYELKKGVGIDHCNKK